MAAEYVDVRHGAYADSVTLMQASRAVADSEGVDAALLAMATPLNVDLAAGMGFELPESTTTNDLLVAIRARDDDALAAARRVADAELTTSHARGSTERAEIRPRTISRAANGRRSLALISVPGQFAFVEAMDALDADCDVMIFSDNVSLSQEIRLKDVATERGRLVMGPDCGTAVVAGVGLGFANVVEPGPVGIVAASGTGCQQVLCLLSAAGVGVSAALGVGGRDLSSAVAGRSTRAALELLEDDPITEQILVISKPPAPEVATDLGNVAAKLSTPVQFALLGPGQSDLTSAVDDLLDSLGVGAPAWPVWPASRTPQARPGKLRGLFAGGTLCQEATVIVSESLGPVWSNMPLRPELALDATLHAAGHLTIDFGDDALTQGRPHPMIDQSLRLERLAAELRDPDVAVVLLDVVLGHGAHPNPASEVAAVIAGADTNVVVTLLGTPGDPQGLHDQAASLAAAGAQVFLSNADATRFAVSLVERVR